MFRVIPHWSPRLAIAALVFLAGTCVVGAATLHRFAVTSGGSGSGGAATFVQSSSTGSALQGEVAASANTGLSLPFGVLGEYDASTSTFGTGVLGISTSGYAVAGESLSPQPSILAYAGGTGIGLEASSSKSGSSPAIYAVAGGSGDGADFVANGAGYGISASSSTGTAGTFTSNGGSSSIFALTVFGGNNNDTNGTGGLQVSTGSCFNGMTLVPSSRGVLASSCEGDAVDAYTQSGTYTIQAKNMGASSTTGYSEAELGAQTGEGLIAKGASGVDQDPVIMAVAGNTSTQPIATYTTVGNASDAVSYKTFIVEGNSADRSGDVMTGGASDVQVSGDLYVEGQVFQDCAGFPITRGGASPSPCAPVPVTQPTTTAIARTAPVEDFGEGQLVSGRAYVRLDPTFARTISTSSPYLTFITPVGDSRGLYVTDRTPQGFEVHENGGGRSSLAFDYRIVAKPYGDTTTERFAAVSLKARTAAKPDRIVTSQMRQAKSIGIPRAAIAPHRFVPPPIRPPVSPAGLPMR
jgi:hypothetical protein